MSYQNGKIYKIIYLKDLNKIYIGSTYRTLKQRFTQHKAQSKKNYENNKITKYNFHTFLFENNYENFQMELIENFPCNSKQELENREHIIMTEYLQQNYELFNICIDHKFKEDVHGHLYNKREKEHNTFKYGSLTFDKTNWKFQYQKNNTTTGKKWSIKKYGNDNAKKLAELYRLKIYPEAINDYDYNYNNTYDELYSILNSEINNTKLEAKKNKPFYPHLGYLYKKYYKKNNYNCFELLWTDNDNKNNSKSFCIEKYGENNAKLLAELYRKYIFPDYINNDIDFNITYETLSKQLDDEILNNKNNSKRFIGVYNKKISYMVLWNENNQNKTKCFSIKKYGEDNSYILACLFAKQNFPIYNNDKISDIKYTFEEYLNLIINK